MAFAYSDSESKQWAWEGREAGLHTVAAEHRAAISFCKLLFSHTIVIILQGTIVDLKQQQQQHTYNFLIWF